MCQQQFSAVELYSSSKANEFFITDYCVDNRVKISFFSVYLLTYAALAVWTSCLLYNDVRAGGRREWNLKKTIYAVVILGCLAEVATMLLFFNGVSHYLRYLAYAVAPLCIRVINGCIFEAWFNTSLGINHEDVNGHYATTFRGASRTVNLLAALNIIALTLAFIVVDSSNNNMVNWLYLFYVSMTGCINAFVNSFALFTTYRLLRAADTGLSETTSSNVRQLIKKLHLFIPMYGVLVIIDLGITFIPFWAYTNLESIFYFHFVVIEGLTLFGLWNTTYSVIKQDRSQTNTKTKSSLNSSSAGGGHGGGGAVSTNSIHASDNSRLRVSGSEMKSRMSTATTTTIEEHF